ncbi:hypothetical protein [Frondihabitans australicus]|nr:hypothetical protein [Frondihabitans australicus]
MATNDEDQFPHIQHPTDYGADTLLDLLYDASRRLMHEYILRLPGDHGPEHPMLHALHAVKAEHAAVPLDDVAAWKRARDDFNRRAEKLRNERRAPPAGPTGQAGEPQ